MDGGCKPPYHIGSVFEDEVLFQIPKSCGASGPPLPHDNNCTFSIYCQIENEEISLYESGTIVHLYILEHFLYTLMSETIIWNTYMNTTSGTLAKYFKLS